MGTPEFAVETLKLLLQNNYNVVGVITVPDKPAGRGQQLQQSAVKKYAIEKGLNILQPEKLKDENFLEQLAELKADLQIVVAFRMLPEVVWKMPRLGTINLHGSLLPHYRGAAPINWAIINGDTKTGVTTFFIEEQIDTGNIIFQEEETIEPNDNIGSLYEKLMKRGANLVIKTTKAISENTIHPIPQDQIPVENLKPAPKINKETCRIDWTVDAETIHNLVRGFSPYPAAWTELVLNNEKTIIKIFSTTVEICHHLLTQGTIITDSKHYLKVATRNGYINICDLQPAGKKRMDATAFLNGHKIKTEEYFI